MRVLLLAFALLPISPGAQAAEEMNAEITPSVVAAEASVPVPVPASAPAQKRFALGLGAGFRVYGGNQGKLYSANALLDLRGNFVVNEKFSLVAGLEKSDTSFDAAPTGPTELSETRLKAGGRFDFLGRREKGFSPYASAALHRAFRSQNYQRFGLVQKDTAFGWSASAGTDYYVIPHSTAIFAEANVGQTLYKDRFDQTFLESGVENMTGATYAGTVGVQMIF